MRFLRTIIPQRLTYSILWFLIAFNSIFFSYVAFARHDNFHSMRLDLGNMEQTVWNFTHGNGFTLTDPTGTENISRLAVHADFLLMFMAPFYLLWQDPKMLLLVQSAVVSLGALPLYWIAKDRLKSGRLALLFSLMYLLYPSLQHILLHDFHAVALSTTFLLFAYWYMVKERYVLFAIFAILAGLGKETVWIATGLMGVAWLFQKKHMLIGAATALVSFAMFYVLFWLVIPSYAVQGQHFALGYLSDFGDSQNSVVVGLLLKPLQVIQTIFLPDRLEYYYRLLLPVGFLPLISPFTLLFAIPSLMINILSKNSLMRQIDYQYTSDIIPYLFVSAVYGFDRARAFLTRMKSASWGRIGVGYLTPLVIACVGVASYLWGEVPLTREDRFYFFTWEQPEKAIMHKVATDIDSVYTVSVTNNIGSHFSARQYLYNFPVNAESADYAVARLGDRYAWPSGDAQREAVELLLRSPVHELVAHQGNFYAFRRKQ